MGKARIMVVDDEAHIQHVVSLKLRNAGYEVMTASDGEEALELITQNLPDLVITDLQMPYMTGLELCQALKKNAATANIPALMLTARGYALAPGEIERTNIRQVMTKPFSPRQVLEVVESVLTGKGIEEGQAA